MVKMTVRDIMNKTTMRGLRDVVITIHENSFSFSFIRDAVDDDNWFDIVESYYDCELKKVEFGHTDDGLIEVHFYINREGER